MRRWREEIFDVVQVGVVVAFGVVAFTVVSGAVMALTVVGTCVQSVAGVLDKVRGR